MTETVLAHHELDSTFCKALKEVSVSSHRVGPFEPFRLHHALYGNIKKCPADNVPPKVFSEHNFHTQQTTNTECRSS
jgi:hypothetical protein